MVNRYANNKSVAILAEIKWPPVFYRLSSALPVCARLQSEREELGTLVIYLINVILCIYV